MRIALKSWIFCIALIGGAVHAENTHKHSHSHSDSKSDSPEFVWTQTSDNGTFTVTLDSQAEKAVEINEFLEWIVTIKTADGEAVTPARVSVGGGMPAHGHGLPSQPQVSEHLGDGKYLLKGLKFNMMGNWKIDLDIQSRSLSDQVSFDIKLDF